MWVLAQYQNALLSRSCCDVKISKIIPSSPTLGPKELHLTTPLHTDVPQQMLHQQGHSSAQTLPHPCPTQHHETPDLIPRSLQKYGPM